MCLRMLARFLVDFRERCADLLGLNGLFESSGLGFLVGEKEGERDVGDR